MKRSLFLSLVFLGACQADIPLQTIPLPFFINGLAVDDFNGDGAAELAIGADGATQIFSRVDGTFVETGAVNGLSSFFVADFDTDGDLDFITTRDFAKGNTNSLELFANTAGSFASIGNVSTPQADRILLGDADGDTDIDVVFSRRVEDVAGDFLRFDIVVLPGDGAGGFGAEVASPLPAQDPFPFIQHFALEDFDGDQIRDLVIGIEQDTAESQMLVMRPQGGGLFGAPEELVETTSGVMFSGDYDGDADLDLMDFPVTAALTPSILLNDGQGVFASSVALPEEIDGTPTERIFVFFIEDINNDQKNEIILDRLSKKTDTLHIFTVSAQGTLETEIVELRPGPDLLLRGFADVDGDGRAETLFEHFDEEEDITGGDPGFALVLFDLP